MRSRLLERLRVGRENETGLRGLIGVMHELADVLAMVPIQRVKLGIRIRNSGSEQDAKVRPRRLGAVAKTRVGGKRNVDYWRANAAHHVAGGRIRNQGWRWARVDVDSRSNRRQCPRIQPAIQRLEGGVKHI